MGKVIGSSVYASIFYRMEITDWVKSGESFSIDDVTEGNLPEFGFNEVSLENVHAENIGYKFYLKAEDWSWYT